MRVLIIEPHRRPKERDVENGYKTLQKLVGGTFQAVYPWDDQAAVICNEEGKLLGLPLNRALYTEDGEMYDVIAGTMVIVGLGTDDFCSLSGDQIWKYKEMFKRPESFAMLNGKLVVVPETNWRK